LKIKVDRSKQRRKGAARVRIWAKKREGDLRNKEADSGPTTKNIGGGQREGEKP